MIKHIIWDFDGTLFNSYPLTIKAMMIVLAKYNIKQSYEDILQHFLISEKYALKYYMDTYNLDSGLIDEFKDEEKRLDLSLIKPFTYALEICQEIKNYGYKNYIFTHRNSTTYEIIKNNNMIDLFEEIVTKENNFKRKPDPEAVLYLLDKYNIKKEEAIIVGDREFEIALGKSINMKTCFYNSGNLKLDLKADYTINSLDEMGQIIKFI